jgi:rhodanese-related sulfurtransferase
VDVPRLDADAFAAALAGERRPFVLDARTAEEFEAGRVPGSVHCHVHDLVRRRDVLPTSKVERILVIAEEGRRGDAAVRFLALLGYADVALVEGGIAAHRGPLETGPPPPPPPRGPELRVLRE